VGEVLQCDCGFEARAADGDGLVAEVQRHAWEAHGMALSNDEALLLALRAKRAPGALPTISGDTTASAKRKGAE
jgi:hypothetical protein